MRNKKYIFQIIIHENNYIFVIEKKLVMISSSLKYLHKYFLDNK